MLHSTTCFLGSRNIRKKNNDHFLDFDDDKTDNYHRDLDQTLAFSLMLITHYIIPCLTLGDAAKQAAQRKNQLCQWLWHCHEAYGKYLHSNLRVDSLLWCLAEQIKQELVVTYSVAEENSVND